MARFFLLTILFLAAVTGVNAADTPKQGDKANRLLDEASPYLRQHAYNPIDWYPWGEAAFKKARKENKPIFLSVGYSTCHWCHVMARESFVDKKIADFLNKHFVAIKVDRERLPDVDETYMLATEIIMQRGGWPNSVFLLPDLKPFHASTYMPKDVFFELLKTIANGWKTNNVAITEQGKEVARVIKAVMSRRVDNEAVTAERLTAAAKKIMKPLDDFYGGFSQAPKFPQESVLLFLGERALNRADEDAANALKISLDGMIQGAIYDHVGGGFHRYTVDNEWRVPHFEKMLYNQALISRALIRSHELTQNNRYESALRKTLDFVIKEMTGKKGGFFSAFDADSKAEDGRTHEGSYYVWNPEMIGEALEPNDAEFAVKALGVTRYGNFERNMSTAHFPRQPDILASEFKLPEEAFYAKVDEITKQLEQVRRKRTPPALDTKIITAWNGMMITAFAEAAAHLNDNRYKETALKAAEHIWQEMFDDKNGLKRIYFDAKSATAAEQEDYAYLAQAYIALYDLTSDGLWLERAQSLAERMHDKFYDAQHGDYFRTAKQVTFTRGKTRNDASIPSGNAIALDVYAKLSRRSQNPKYRERADALVKAQSGIALNGPGSNAYALMAADRFLNGHIAANQFLGKGTVRAKARYHEKEKQLKIAINIAPGWHINANEVTNEYQIPTEIKLTDYPDTKSKISYPAPIVRKLGFADEKLPLYEGHVEIKVPVEKMPNTGQLKAQITLQACSEKICLEPETRTISVRIAR